MKQNRLSRFEDHIQRLVEGGFARLFAGRLHPREVAIQLARAMEDHAQKRGDGVRIAPDVYTVRLNPQDHEAVLAAQPDLARALSEEVIELARTGGLQLQGAPEVHLVADENVGVYQVSMSAQVRPERRETTQGVSLSEISLSIPAPQAVLVLTGSHNIPLSEPIINIGRQRDNDVILDHPGVSRYHAQLRLRFGRYMLFDLGSTRGTLINGQPVREAVLQSGDVIRLADVTLIYVEEAPAPPANVDLGGTQPFSPLK